jgi:hypothetical protein
MASAHPLITSSGPSATRGDRPIAPVRGMDQAGGLHALLVCTSAVLLITALLHVILLFREDALSSAASAMAVGYAAMVIGGGLAALSTVVVLLSRAPQALPTGAAFPRMPLGSAPVAATSGGLKVAAVVHPRRPIGRAAPSQRLSPSARLAAARRAALRPPYARAPVRSPVQRAAAQPTPVRQQGNAGPLATSTRRRVALRTVAPRSTAALRAPSRPAPSGPPVALPRTDIAREQLPHPATVLPPRPNPVTWQAGAPSSPRLLDRLLGRVPQPVAHS